MNSLHRLYHIIRLSYLLVLVFTNNSIYASTTPPYQTLISHFDEINSLTNNEDQDDFQENRYIVVDSENIEDEKEEEEDQDDVNIYSVSSTHSLKHFKDTSGKLGYQTPRCSKQKIYILYLRLKLGA
ncbi:hypothetical protein [Aquimarina sp. 2201CG5-10]|uniref:hypothetical protein n=1 Tax=Aquimarina callyspongiae TaxID=3098150 RepID=UPI002AB3A11B|nr:hypothetical protein [Aquimarina sp. 2201CG5-10]MDY8136147.1 hypothetical protein [Aquimarina sp. 2201CG5-10]